MKYSELTSQIIKAFYEVYNRLGYGFLEKVCENALKAELAKLGLDCENQFPIDVYYKDTLVGSYYADLLVSNLIIIELKAAELICKEHELQLINYLKATKFEVGLLFNFGKKPEFKRKIYSNDRKQNNHR